MADNTLVVFTNDNGGPGYIGLPDINKPFRGWKISQFEGIRVPLMMKWPARISPGTVSEPVAHIDVMPTLAAAAEAPEPEGVIIDGENLLLQQVRDLGHGTVTRCFGRVAITEWSVTRIGSYKSQRDPISNGSSISLRIQLSKSI